MAQYRCFNVINVNERTAPLFNAFIWFLDHSWKRTDYPLALSDFFFCYFVYIICFLLLWFLFSLSVVQCIKCCISNVDIICCCSCCYCDRFPLLLVLLFNVQWTTIYLYLFCVCGSFFFSKKEIKINFSYMRSSMVRFLLRFFCCCLLLALFFFST